MIIALLISISLAGINLNVRAKPKKPEVIKRYDLHLNGYFKGSSKCLNHITEGSRHVQLAIGKSDDGTCL